MNADYLRQWIGRVKQDGPRESPLPPEPEHLTRHIRPCSPPAVAQAEGIMLLEARARIGDAITAYLAGPAGCMLLIKAAPGVGKTHAAVAAAEACAQRGLRVLYAGPRHDFYSDIMAMAGDPSLWYEWLPQQDADAERGKPCTCRHALPLRSWLERGYRGIEFCKRVCGWDNIQRRCAYHAQRRRSEPCIFGMHQHITLGHPLHFDVVIGDESPLGAFTHRWRIPSRWIWPRDADPTEPMADVLIAMARLSEAGECIKGEHLLSVLGGASHVLAACEAPQRVLPPPQIRSAGQVDGVPYAHPQYVALMLAREARCALAGQAYIPRVIVADSGLLLLLRRPVNTRLPGHVVWLDATAEPHLYQACFGRGVELVDAQPRLQGRIYQVYNRANGRRSLVDRQGNVTTKVAHLGQQVERIIELYGYRHPAVAAYDDVLQHLELFKSMPHVHFFAARGTNALQDTDVLFVAGTPQPPLDKLESDAAMLFWERMDAFQREFTARYVPYSYVDPADGLGREYPVSGFWSDPDLQSILWSKREAEVIQLAHRCRPVVRAVDIWLLTNLPIAELPPMRLLSLHELMGAPEGVNVFTWARWLKFVAGRDCFTREEAQEATGLDRDTVARYMNLLVQSGEWRHGLVRTNKRGRPPRFVERAA